MSTIPPLQGEFPVGSLGRMVHRSTVYPMSTSPVPCPRWESDVISFGPGHTSHPRVPRVVLLVGVREDVPLDGSSHVFYKLNLAFEHAPGPHPARAARSGVVLGKYDRVAEQAADVFVSDLGRVQVEEARLKTGDCMSARGSCPALYGGDVKGGGGGWEHYD